MSNKQTTTTAPVAAGDISQVLPEWGRLGDLQRVFGLRRGTAYALIRDGRIKSCLLRVQGRKSGVRLIHLQSVRDLIANRMRRDGEQEVAA